MPTKNYHNNLESKISKKITNSKQTGFSLIELLLVVVIIGIIAAIAIPNLLASRRAANESSAVATLRIIHSAQALYLNTHKIKYGTLPELQASGLIDSLLGTAPFTKHSYIFNVTLIPAGANISPGFDAQAQPTIHTFTQPLGGTGTRDFGVNEVGVIYQTNNDTRVTFNATTRAPLGGSVVVQP